MVQTSISVCGQFDIYWYILEAGTFVLSCQFFIVGGQMSRGRAYVLHSHSRGVDRGSFLPSPTLFLLSPTPLLPSPTPFVSFLPGKCIHWTKSLGPFDLGPVQIIFSWTKWGVFLGLIPVGPGIKLPVRPF